MKPLLKFLLAAFLTPALRAAPVYWDTSSVSSPADVLTEGVLVGAMSVGSPTDNTVNGVLFAADPEGVDTPLPLGWGTVKYSFAGNYNNDFWYTEAPGGDAAYGAALDTGRYADEGSRTGTVTLGGLVPDRSYLVQLWIVDTRSFESLTTRVRSVKGDEETATSLTSGGPNIVTGYFDADGPTQTITITGLSGGNSTPHGPQLNMLQLRETYRPVIVVTSTADSGPGSLRVALSAAAADPGPDFIYMSNSIRGQTITVGNSPLIVNDSGGVWLDASGVTLERKTVSISPMLRLTGGKLQLDGAHLRGGGAGVSNGGAIEVDIDTIFDMSRSTISGHRSAGSPGLFNAGTATLSNCTVTGNSSDNGAGAIENAGSLSLRHCTVVGNAANGAGLVGGGGGIENSSAGSTNLTACIVAQNTATNGVGPDVRLRSGSLNARHCFIGNGADSTIVNGESSNRVGTGAAPLLPKLAPLGYFGTQGRFAPPTMPPLAGSPVIGVAPVVAGSEHEQGGSSRGYGLWTSNFFEGLNGAVARGSGTVVAGSFRLTPEVADQSGSLILPEVPGMGGGFLATFDYGFNAASGPADGFCFAFGADPGYNINDVGDGVAHVVRFDIYNGGGGSFGRISYRKNGVEVGSANTTALHRFNDKNQLLPITVRLFYGGHLVVTYKGTTVIDVETGYSHTASDRIMFGSRTGGLKADQRIVNIGVRTSPLGSQDLGATETLITNNPVVDNDGDPDDYSYSRQSDGSVRGFSLRQAMLWAHPSANITFSPFLTGETIVLNRQIDLTDSVVSTVALDASGLPGGVTVDAGSGATPTTDKRRIFSLPNNRTLNLTAMNLINGRAGGSGDDGYGGAIYSYGNITLNRCTLSGNSGQTGGGAIFNGGIAVLNRCTVANNNSSPSGAQGGGIRNTASLQLNSCTVANNYGVIGGGIYNATGAIVTCRNSILVNSIGGGDIRNFGTVTLENGNLFFTSISNNGTVNGAPTKGSPSGLGLLGNYGGPTPTMPLRPGSNAIGAASFATGPDQRGFPIVGQADLGAYEAGTFTDCNAWLWETLPTSTPVEQLAGTADLDGDGATNEQEWVALTQPNNPTSVWRSTATRSGGTLVISFPTVSGRKYTLMGSDFLDYWYYYNLPEVTGDGAIHSLTVPIPDGGYLETFYRVMVQF